MSWKSSQVRAVAELAIGPFGSSLKSDLYVANGMPVVAGGNLGHGRWPDLADCPHVDAATVRRLTRSVACEGDLITPHRGSIGRVAVANHPMMLSTSMMRARFDPNVVDPEFAYWFFLAEGARELLTMASSVGTPGIGQPLQSLGSVTIRFPELSVQQAIGEVLGALDDKIAANRRVVEAADSWVRASYSALRLSELTLDDISVNVRESVDSAAIDPAANYVALEHFDRGSMWLFRHGLGIEATSAKSVYRRGDTLFGKLRPYFHKVAIAPTDGVCSTDVLVVRARDQQLAPLVAAAASSEAVVQAAVSASNGTRMPRAKWTDIAKCPVPDPVTDDAQRFIREVMPIASRVSAAVAESERLASTRDELLPLLMSGKIAVKDAEKTVEGAV